MIDTETNSVISLSTHKPCGILYLRIDIRLSHTIVYYVYQIDSNNQFLLMCRTFSRFPYL